MATAHRVAADDRARATALDLCISVRRQGQRTVLTVAGELDLATSPALAACLGEPGAVDREMVVDLSQVSFIDICGLRTLVAARLGATSRGQRFRLVRTSPSLDRLLAITGAASQLGLPEPQLGLAAPQLGLAEPVA